MEYVVFDLEWNGALCKKLDCHINEIIEIGAVKLDEDLNIIDKFSMLVKPVIGKKLSSPVQELTALTYEELSRGTPFSYAYSKFAKFCSGCVLMTWSTSDIDALLSNVRYHFHRERIDMMSDYIDLQKYCHDRLMPKEQNPPGLHTVVEMLDIDADNMTHHRALDDSIVSALCLKRIYAPGSLEPYITRTDDEFYDKLMFHPYNITDPNDKRLNWEEIYFNCPDCTARGVQKKKWELKYNAFFLSEYECPECHSSFTGRVQFRQKYDHLTVMKKTIKKKKPEKEQNEQHR